MAEVERMGMPEFSDNPLADMLLTRDEAPVSGADQIAAVPPPIDTTATQAQANVIANTGAQRNAVPSYAADVASRGDRISRILEKQLMEATRPGFGDIISAAMNTIAGRGKVSFAGALREAQGQDLTRAYNIANALSGLQRRTQEDVVPVTLPSGQTVRVGANAALTYLKENRTRNPEAAQALSLIERASSGFENQPQAMATMAKVLSEVANEADPISKTMSRVMNDPRVRALPPRKARVAEEPETDMGGPTVNADGDVTKHRPFKAIKGQSLTPEMKQYNAAISAGNTKLADDIYYRVIGRTPSGLRPEDRRQFENFLRAHNSAVGSLGVIDQISEIIGRNPAALSQVGAIQNTLNSGIQQIASLLDSISSDRSATDQERNRADEVRRGLADPTRYAKVADEEMKKWFSGPQANALRTAGIDNAQLRSLFVNLAYTMAQANEPGGRFATQDVENAMRQVGATQGDPRALQRVLKQTSDTIQSRMERERQITTIFGQSQTPWSPSLDVGTISRLVRGEPSAARLRVPQTTAAPAPSPVATPPISVPPFQLDPKVQSVFEKYRQETQ